MADPQEISWEAPAHEHREHGTDWYWALGVLAISGAVISFLLNNPLFAIIIALGAFSLGILASRKPHTYDVHIDTRGITIEENLYLFRSLESFWVDTEREEPHLIVASRGLLTPQLVLPLRGVEENRVRSFLLNYLAEKEQYESPFTRIAELLGL